MNPVIHCGLPILVSNGASPHPYCSPYVGLINCRGNVTAGQVNHLDTPLQNPNCPQHVSPTVAVINVDPNLCYGNCLQQGGYVNHIIFLPVSSSGLPVPYPYSYSSSSGICPIPIPVTCTPCPISVSTSPSSSSSTPSSLASTRSPFSTSSSLACQGRPQHCSGCVDTACNDLQSNGRAEVRISPLPTTSSKLVNDMNQIKLDDISINQSEAEEEHKSEGHEQKEPTHDLNELSEHDLESPQVQIVPTNTIQGEAEPIRTNDLPPRTNYKPALPPFRPKRGYGYVPKNRRLYGCNFCKSNKESRYSSETHNLMDSTGAVTCPFLRRVVCPLCQKTGKYAHTLRFCPKYRDYFE